MRAWMLAVAAVVFVASGLDRPVGDVVLVLAAGMRLAAYIGGTAGELGFLRGFWLDASRRLVWLEDYARAATPASAKSGDISTSEGRSVMPQAWIMRTTTRSAAPDQRPRADSARIIAKERA